MDQDRRRALHERLTIPCRKPAGTGLRHGIGYGASIQRRNECIGCRAMTVATSVALRVFGLLVLGTVLSGCQHPHREPLNAIDWRTSPLDLNLRGMNGKSYLFRCPAGKPLPGSVTGSGPYTDASSICAAAAHAGALDAQRGGTVM